MSIKTVKTSTLTGSALDWAVAKCEGLRPGISANGYILVHDIAFAYAPSSDWSQGGPIIERERLELGNWGSDAIAPSAPNEDEATP